MDSSLRRRVPTAIVYGVVVLAALYFGQWPFVSLVTVGALLAYYELWRLFARSRFAPSLGGGFALVLLFLTAHLVWSEAAVSSGPLAQLGLLAPFTPANLIAVAMLISGLGVLGRREPAYGLLSSAVTLLGALYCGWLLGYLIDLAVLAPHVNAPVVDPTVDELRQRSWLIFAFLPTWAADVAAYAVGSAVGRHKLAPRLSPGKTVEGTLGGIAAATIVGVLVATSLGFAWQTGVGVGIVVGVLGLVGDLAESAIKRAAAAKDSGTLLPGHGGVLDRIDSIVFVAPALVIFFELKVFLS